MRKALLVAITAGGMAVGGAAFATAGELPGAAADAAAGAAADCQVQAPPRMMSAAQAADAVLQDAGGGRVRSVKLAEEKGAAVYTVSLVTGSRLQAVKVDAFTGELSAGAGAEGAGNTGGAADSGAVGDQGAESGAQQRGDDEGDDGDDEGEDGGPVRGGVSGSK